MTHVAGHEPNGRDKARKHRRSAGVGLSVLAHMVVLAVIGMNVPRPIYRQSSPAPPANIWLMPRLTPAQHRSDHQIAAPKTPPPAPLKPVKAASAPTPVETAASPGRPAPIGAKPGQPSAEPGEEGGVREALRTSVGCDADRVVHLTPGEHDRCDQKFGEMAKTAPPFSGLDPLKRGRFDAQAEADERRRANRQGPMQELVVPCSGEGSNLGGGCLPDSAIVHIHQH